MLKLSLITYFETDLCTLRDYNLAKKLFHVGSKQIKINLNPWGDLR